MTSVVLVSAEPLLSAMVRGCSAFDPALAVFAATSLGTSALATAQLPIGAVFVANPPPSWSIQRIHRAVRAVDEHATVATLFVADRLAADADRADALAVRWLRGSDVVPARDRLTAAARRASTPLDVDLGAPAVARRFVRTVLAEWDRDDLVEAAQLCASELATNAVLHATQGPIELALAADDGDEGVHLRVSDGCVDRLPVGRRPSSRSRGGRGLRIVEATTTRWGVTVTPTQKHVWCELGRAVDAGDLLLAGVEPLEQGASVEGAVG